MRFQGENCTLSLGLSFNGDRALLTGSIGLPHLALISFADQPPRLRFDALLSETDLIRLQRWLLEGSSEPFPLPDPIRQVRRLDVRTDDLVHLELEYHRPAVPGWWNWPVTQPLTIRLSIRPNEFAYLTGLLSRDSWTNDMKW